MLQDKHPQQTSVNLIRFEGKKKDSCLQYRGNLKAEIKIQSEIGKAKVFSAHALAVAFLL